MPSSRKRAPAARRPASRSARSAPARRSSRAGRRRRRGASGMLGALRAPSLPVLDQRQRDVLGLALIAAGVFMGFVLYGSGGADAGGRAGHAIAVALGWTLGRARGLAPVALALAGGVLLLRPVLPAVRP